MPEMSEVARQLALKLAALVERDLEGEQPQRVRKVQPTELIPPVAQYLLRSVGSNDYAQAAELANRRLAREGLSARVTEDGWRFVVTYGAGLPSQKARR